MNSKETFNSSVDRAGGIESFSWQLFRQLASRMCAQWIDLAWLASLLLLLSGNAKLLFLHVLFGILSFGAAHWSPRAFVWKASTTIILTIGIFGIVPEYSLMQESVLLEISTFAVIVSLFFAIAQQRSAAENELRQEKRELEKRLAEGTARLEMALQARQQSERSLLESQERYQQLLDHSSDGIIIHNGISVLAINAAAVRLLGESKAEKMIGKSIATWITPDQLKTLQLNRGQEQTTPNELLRLTASRIDREAITLKIGYQERPAWMTILHERTLHKQNELARSAERIAIARDLHDTLGQNLGFLHLKLDQILYFADEHSLSSVREDLVKMRTVANEAYCQVRELIASLRMFNHVHLGKGLCELARVLGDRGRLDIEVVEIGNERVMSSEKQQQVLALCREALTNVIKHANATQAKVNLRWASNQVVIEICDNGCGFDPSLARAKGTFGLQGMNERAEQVNGTLTIRSHPNQGTTLTLQLPLLPVTL